MRQVHDLAITEVTFEYTGTNYGADDLEEIMRNTIEFQTYFQSLEWTEQELEHIRKELVETGKVFARNQGFSDAETFTVSNGYRFRVNTGQLVRGIKADLIKQGQNKGISFYNDAQNSRHQPYAAHLEYGFHDRGGNFIPARPFMRPAFYAVAEGSKGNFQQIMKGLLDNLWKSGGYRGVWQTDFGRKSGSQSNFWTKPNFSKGVGGMSRISELKGMHHRGGMSMFRNSKERGRGIWSAKNRADYRPKGLNKVEKKAARAHDTKYKNKIENQNSNKNNIRSRLSAENRNSQVKNVSYLTQANAQGQYKHSERYNMYKGGKTTMNMNIQKDLGKNYNYDKLIHEYVKAGFTWEQAAERVRTRYG